MLPDLIIPVLALGFTAYYLTTITEVPWISQASAITVGCLLILAILALFVRTAIRVRQGRETIAFRGFVPEPVIALKRAALLALTIAYVLLIESLGFTLTTVAFVFLGVVLLSSLSNWRRALAVSLGCSVTGYIVFIQVFKTRFPKGWVEHTLQALF